MTHSSCLSICGEVERPARLAPLREWDCFLSVKSVDRIEVTREPAQATAETIALARLESS
jgi:hypothetical protein